MILIFQKVDNSIHHGQFNPFLVDSMICFAELCPLQRSEYHYLSFFFTLIRKWVTKEFIQNWFIGIFTSVITNWKITKL